MDNSKIAFCTTSQGSQFIPVVLPNIVSTEDTFNPKSIVTTDYGIAHSVLFADGRIWVKGIGFDGTVDVALYQKLLAEYQASLAEIANKQRFEVARPAASYWIPEWALTEKGLVATGNHLQLNFVKGDRRGMGYHQDGIVTEGLVAMLAKHFEELGQEVPNEYTPKIIEKFNEILKLITQRHLDRVYRGVYGTKEK